MAWDIRWRNREQKDKVIRMKSLLKIIRRYIGSAFCITFAILILNLVCYAYVVLHYDGAYGNVARISDVSKEVVKSEQGLSVTAKGMELLEDYKFAFILDDDGYVIWEYQVPAELPKHYTSFQIASFSRWYLEEYPVTVWEHANGLLVLGQEKNTVWKTQLMMGYNMATHFASFLGFILLGNAILILLLCCLMGLRFFYSLKPIVSGMEMLAKGEPISLKEKGLVAQLAQKLNQTSKILEKQNKLIEARDQARTNWIAGVSHDIRTPLSMVMGYAEQLEYADNLNEEQISQVQTIKNQSMKIKKLIEDLNLTSKLQYQMQPLRKEKYHPAKLLREMVASYYNNGLSDMYDINLEISREVEGLTLEGDMALLTRAYENLIGNSIRHNKQGCHIDIYMRQSENQLEIRFCDDGCGIPDAVVKCLKEDEHGTDEENINGKPHVMGMHVVKQIIGSHQGSICIQSEGQGAVVQVLLPINF